jgi:hypothetical protein
LYEPSAIPVCTVNWPEVFPVPVNEQLDKGNVEAAALLMLHRVASALNPAPITLTVRFAVPALGSRVILGRTMKPAFPASIGVPLEGHLM